MSDQSDRETVGDGAEQDEDAGRPPSRVGSIIAPDEGLLPDREPRLVAREGGASSWNSPEESAMHYVDGEEEELSEVEWEPSDRLPAEEE